MPRGEWWIDDINSSSFADGDIGDYNHAMYAFGSAIGLDEDQLRRLYDKGVECDANGIDFRAAAKVWIEENLEEQYQDLDLTDPRLLLAIREHGTDLDCVKEFVGLFGSDVESRCTEDDVVRGLGTAYLLGAGADKGYLEWYLSDPQGDPRDYAIEHMGWVRVDDNSFQTWNFDDNALAMIRSFDGFEGEDGLDEDDDDLVIEELSTGKNYTVSKRMLFDEALDAVGIKTLHENEEELQKYERANKHYEGEEHEHLSLNPPRLNAAFWKWFGNSVVRNKDGTPKVVYHGTSAKITRFRRDGRASGMGAYFTSDRKSAKSFAEGDASIDGDAPIVMSVYLSLQNPYVTEFYFDPSTYDEDADPQVISKVFMDRLESAGYDGIIITNTNEYVAFYPTQIKSIDNDGTWGLDDPNIRSNPPVPRTKVELLRDFKAVCGSDTERVVEQAFIVERDLGVRVDVEKTNSEYVIFNDKTGAFLASVDRFAEDDREDDIGSNPPVRPSLSLNPKVSDVIVTRVWHSEDRLFNYQRMATGTYQGRPWSAVEVPITEASGGGNGVVFKVREYDFLPAERRLIGRVIRKAAPDDSDYDSGDPRIGSNPPPARFWGRSGAGILFHCTADDTYLLVLRSAQVEQPGTLGIPGGACGKEGFFTGKEGKQIGEAQAWVCAMRETKEELGWWPKKKQVAAAIVYERENFQYQTFIVDIPASEKAEATIQLNWENDEFIWTSLAEMAEAREQLHFGLQYVLDQLGV